MSADSSEIIQCPCEKCGGDRDHLVMHTHTEKGVEDNLEWRDEYRTIRCLGCRSVGIRHDNFFSEDVGYDEGLPSWTKYFPPRLMHRIPDWIDELDQDMQDLLHEIYDAYRNKNYRLVAMGIRTIVDLISIKKVGDQGTFPQKLAALEKARFIGGQQKDILETVVDAGSAVSHRGYKPSEGLIAKSVAVMQSLIDQVYISSPILKAAKEHIPPRPKISKSTKSAS